MNKNTFDCHPIDINSLKMIQIFKLLHEGKKYIGINKNKSKLINTQIESIKSVWFSMTYNCYVLPHSITEYNQLIALNITVKYKINGTAFEPEPSRDITVIGDNTSQIIIPTTQDVKKDMSIAQSEKVNIHWSGKFFIINTGYSPIDVKMVKKLERSYWNATNKKWIAKSSISNLDRLQKHFNFWSGEEFLKLYELIQLQQDPLITEFYITPEFPNKFVAKLRGFKMDLSRIKSISGRQYDSEYKRWIVPYSKETIKNLTAYYSNNGGKVINRIAGKDINKYIGSIPKVDERNNKLLDKFPKEYVGVLKPYIERMTVQNYGWRTVQSYTRRMAQYIEYLGKVDISHASVADVNEYLTQLAKSDASESLVNIVFSAIKLYYEKVIYKKDFEFEKLVRPKKGRYLPTILSEKEVERMFRAFTNLKHISIAYMIYSGGLRLSEILRIRVQDVLWDRNQLMIKSGKGNKDRVTLLGSTLKNVLKRYFDEYQPQYWLFEGMDKKSPYSNSSVQNIIKKAALKARISRRVTPHTLRHCFATHLLDHGTDVRYIQELLGHKDIKTTLIYTHVTTSSINKIESPLDKLYKGDKL